MVNYTTNELQEARRPIASLIAKSEKAQQNLTPGTWQHAMLRDNLKALRIACALMTNEVDDTNSFRLDDLHEAVRSLDSMINRTEKAQEKFVPGTSQHTLLRNRLKALKVTKLFVGQAFNETNARSLQDSTLVPFSSSMTLAIYDQ